MAFNRLYAEATYRLARRGQVKLRERFPDSQAAQDYVVQFCGAEMLIGAWEDNPPSALHEIAQLCSAKLFVWRAAHHEHDLVSMVG